MAHARGSWVLVAVLLGGLAFYLWDARGGSSEPRAAPERDQPARAEPVPSPSAPPPEAAISRAELETDASTPVPSGLELRGVVRAGDGAPLPGASVRLMRPAFRGFDLRGGAQETQPEPVAELQSDERGEFRFALDEGERVDVEARREGSCPARASDRGAGDFVELVLLAGLRVRGRVTRARDGSPVEGARVSVREPGTTVPQPDTFTAADGMYSVRVAAPGGRLRVEPVAEQSSPLLPLRFDAGGECVLDVAVEDGVRVEGRVSERETGRPLAALVQEGRLGGRSVATNRGGEYVLTGFGNPDVAVLFASSPGYTRARGTLGAPVDGRMRVDFELARGRVAYGRVLDERARPVEKARVLAVGQDGQDDDWRTSWTRADGTFVLTDLAPELRHACLVSAPGHATQVHDLPPDELERHEIDLGTLVLRAPRALRGRVVDEHGEPLAGVIVSASGWNADRFALGRSPEEAAGSHHVAIRERVSDAAGRFAFADLAPGEYTLGARASGRPAPAEQHLRVAAKDLKTEIVLPGGDGIHGVVRDEHGQPLAAIHVNLSAEELRDPAAALDGRTLSVRTKEGGAFEFTGLPAGVYALELFPTTFAPEDLRTPLLATSVAHVGTGSAPLEVVLPRGLTIEGVLRDAKGAALGDHSVSAVDTKGEIGWTAYTDAEGRFALPVARGTSWTLEVYGPGQLEGPPVLSRPGVAAGTLDLLIELR